MENIGNPRVRGPNQSVPKGEVVPFKTLIKHPMESGLRKDPETGETIPAYHIDQVTVEYGGKTVLQAVWTGAISKNPYFSFYVKADKTGPVQVTWKDTKGMTFTAQAILKVG